MSKLIPLYTPYSMKDELKIAQCKWDKINRYWVANTRILSKHPELQKYANQPSKSYFNLPFEQKDEFKAVGGKWDSNVRKWYLMSFEEVPEQFLKYTVEIEDDWADAL